MRQECAVPEARERVDDRGRLYDHLDPVVREREQPVRLDQLEALVRERRRVDRDLRAHAPGRMRERLLGGDVGQLGARAPAERPSRGRQDDAGDGLRIAPLEALVERRVLAVDREELASAAAPGGHRQLAAGDEALLVREREGHAVLERPERRRHAREADDRVQDDVRLAALEQRNGVTAHLRVADTVLRRERVERRRP